MENAVKQVQGLARTLKVAPERAISKSIPLDHPVISWPVEHAAFILTARRLKRKQSNRESARRSRLRKQAECEGLSGRVSELEAALAAAMAELVAARAEIDALRAERGAPVSAAAAAAVPAAAAAIVAALADKAEAEA